MEDYYRHPSYIFQLARTLAFDFRKSSRGNSEFIVKFLGRIFQFLYASKSSCDLIIYNFSDDIARYFGRLCSFSTLTKYSRFCDLTWLISNWIHVIDYVWKLSLLIIRNASEKAHFVSKVMFVVVCLHCVYANYFHIAGSCFSVFWCNFLMNFPLQCSF